MEPDTRKYDSFVTAVREQWGVWIGLLLIIATTIVTFNVRRDSAMSNPAPVDAQTDIPRPNPLTVDDRFLDFGEVLVQPRHVVPFQIRNQGDVDVVIDSFNMSCSCTSITPGRLIVPAGQTATAELAIDLTDPDPAVAFQASRRVTTSVAPELRDESIQPTVWTFAGRATSPAAVSVSSLGFPKTVEGIEAEPESFTVTPYTPAGDVDVHCDPELATVQRRLEDSRADADQSQTYVVQVQPNSALRPGLYDFRIELTTADQGGRTTISVPAQIEIVHDIQFDPPTLLMGTVTRGQPATESVSVYSLNNRPFSLNEPSLVDSQVSVEVSQRADARYRLDVVLNPAGEGIRKGQLTVEGTTEDGAEFRRAIPWFCRVTK